MGFGSAIELFTIISNVTSLIFCLNPNMCSVYISMIQNILIMLLARRIFARLTEGHVCSRLRAWLLMLLLLLLHQLYLDLVQTR